jgi:hypothetical protein
MGRELCRAAEEWARGCGVTRIRVRSNVIRERAHAFYLRDGYARVKTSAVFEKVLAARADAPAAPGSGFAPFGRSR